jgi:DNA-binding PadR family transcriptional regulator
VLGALHDHPAHWRYGYDISRETGLGSATLYPILGRLADRGLLDGGAADVPSRTGGTQTGSERH